MNRMDDLQDIVRQDVRERVRFEGGIENVRDPFSMIDDILDSCVPVYTYDRLMLAVENPELATTIPEFGVSDDTTAEQLIYLNLYEELYQTAIDEIEALEHGTER